CCWQCLADRWFWPIPAPEYIRCRTRPLRRPGAGRCSRWRTCPILVRWGSAPHTWYDNFGRWCAPMGTCWWRWGIVSLTLQLLGLVGPLFLQVIIDKVLVYHDTSLLWLMLCGMLFTTAFQLIGGTLREFLLAHTLRRVNAFLLLRFFHH